MPPKRTKAAKDTRVHSAAVVVSAAPFMTAVKLALAIVQGVKDSRYCTDYIRIRIDQEGICVVGTDAARMHVSRIPLTSPWTDAGWIEFSVEQKHLKELSQYKAKWDLALTISDISSQYEASVDGVVSITAKWKDTRLKDHFLEFTSVVETHRWPHWQDAIPTQSSHGSIKGTIGNLTKLFAPTTGRLFVIHDGVACLRNNEDLAYLPYTVRDKRAPSGVTVSGSCRVTFDADFVYRFLVELHPDLEAIIEVCDKNDPIKVSAITGSLGAAAHPAYMAIFMPQNDD